MFKDYRIYLADIEDALIKIMLYTKEISREEFTGNSKTSDAVIYNLEKISAASGQLPDKVRYLARDVKWDKLEVLGEVLSTQITSPNRELAWEAAKALLPPLGKSLTTLKKWSGELAARENMGRGMQTPEQEYERWY